MAGSLGEILLSLTHISAGVFDYITQLLVVLQAVFVVSFITSCTANRVFSLLRFSFERPCNLCQVQITCLLHPHNETFETEHAHGNKARKQCIHVWRTYASTVHNHQAFGIDIAQEVNFRLLSVLNHPQFTARQSLSACHFPFYTSLRFGFLLRV